MLRQIIDRWNKFTPTEKYNVLGLTALLICLYVIRELDSRNLEGVTEYKERNKILREELVKCHQESAQKDKEFIFYLQNENIKKRNIVDTLKATK